jgi:hypothetical protein
MPDPLYPRPPAFRPIFEAAANPIAVPDHGPAVTWLTAMAHGFIADAVPDTSTAKDQTEGQS